MFFEKIKRKLGMTLGFVLMFINLKVQYAYAGVDSGSLASVVDNGIKIVAVIPAVMGVYAFVNAGIAFAQSQQEGGNAQASAKMSNNIVAGIVCVAVALAVIGPLGDLVKGFAS